MINKKNKFKILSIVILLFLTVLGVEIGFRFLEKALEFSQRSSSSNDMKTLAIIGGSTSKGVPFQDKISIPKLVAFSFNDSILGKSLNIINNSKPGENIESAYWQARNILLEHGSQEGILLVYTGINDALKESEDVTFKVWKFFQKSIILRKLFFIFRLNDNSYRKYEYWYEEILKMAQEKNWFIISSTLVGNYSDFDPNVNENEITEYTDKEKQCFDSIYLNDHFEECKTISLNKESSYIQFLVGRQYEKKGSYDSAALFYINAIKYEYSIRPSLYKNNLIKRISKKYEIINIDPFVIFKSLSTRPLPGYDLFMDAHHPTIFGYVQLSKMFAAEISNKFNAPIKKDIENFELLKNNFELDSLFVSDYNSEIASWHLIESDYTIFPRIRIEKAYEYLNLSILYNKKSKTAYFWKLYYYMIQNDSDRFIELFNQKKNSISFNNFNFVWNSSEGKNVLKNLDLWFEEENIDEKIYREINKKLL